MSQRKLNAYVAHELRTHIAVARGYAELIQAAYTGEEAAEDAVVIIDELDRLSAISERLLLLSVLDKRRLLMRAPVDLRRLVEDAAKRWRVAGPRSWRVVVDSEGAVLADRGRLETMLDLLLENAVKFTSEGDHIGLLVRAEGGKTAVVEVSDGGSGIPPQHLPRIFDRFYRVDDDHGCAGTGLGLAIVRAIVQAHHGSVEVRSEVGKGTTFAIRLRRAGESRRGLRRVRSPNREERAGLLRT
jgi:two-component system, OmpR family, sensor kinase